MKTATLPKESYVMHSQNTTQHHATISGLIQTSWRVIAPFWPLKNLIAVNPLQGFEDLPFEEALKTGEAYFQQINMPTPMEAVNRQTIKWLQAYFDEGQATIAMPYKHKGLYAAWRSLAIHDKTLHHNNAQNKERLQSLPATAEQAIAEYFLHLSITKEDREQFLNLMLTTLPGWAGYIKYRTEWEGQEVHPANSTLQADYLAIRLIICSLLWPQAKQLLDWHQISLQEATLHEDMMETIIQSEQRYRAPLLNTLAAQSVQKPHVPQAQLVFCIDVRSEPFRRALEATGDYQTFGFAGFFGVPVQITDNVTNISYASCPVLLSPKHKVVESPCESAHCTHDRKNYEKLTNIKRIYQSVKYNFTSPLALVEALGLASGAWMVMRSFAPNTAYALKTTITNAIRKPQNVMMSLDTISLDEQCGYAKSVLTVMGLTNDFAPLVILCGHGSTTQNNAYASALDCGACGGRHGAGNARVLAKILNNSEVRSYLKTQQISIPASTRFIAAEHNTTTDEVTLYGADASDAIQQLKQDLEKARLTNSKVRLDKLQARRGNKQESFRRSQDWAQVRPEWGLARNSCFIVAPRDITRQVDLEGRSFLHSYDYTQDIDGASLTAILTAPMVVAQWINSQYLFSTLDNIAYGGGSKITKNITGKMGIMQGNASDLMVGLPLQSVYSSDSTAYHEPQRLMTVVYAPRHRLDTIIQQQPVLQKLFGNGWVQLACIEPDTHMTYFLQRDLSWQVMQ